MDGSWFCEWGFEVDSAGEWAGERGMERDACEGGGMEYMSVSDHCQFLSLVSAVGSLGGMWYGWGSFGFRRDWWAGGDCFTEWRYIGGGMCFSGCSGGGVVVVALMLLSNIIMLPRGGMLEDSCHVRGFCQDFGIFPNASCCMYAESGSPGGQSKRESYFKLVD
jgi:hypothetical protein